MKGIPYDHNGEIKVMSVAELTSVPQLHRSFATPTVPELIKATIATAEQRPGKVRPKHADILWHMGGYNPKCKRGKGKTRIARHNFGAKVRQGVSVCKLCRLQYEGSMRKAAVYVKPPSAYFDKHDDAAFPVDVMSK